MNLFARFSLWKKIENRLNESISKAENRLNESISKAENRLNESIQSTSAGYTSDIRQVRKYLQTIIERAAKNCAKQVMASAACEAYFTSGVLPSFNSESHTWPISSDFAFYLIELLETESYDLIVEFGTGHSTVLVSRVLAQMASRQGAKPAAQFLSFDHLPEYYNRTQALLQLAKTRELVDLRLAPLTPYTAPNGKSYPYYSCQVAIQELAQHQPLQGLKVLAIIDGPPSTTGEHARYPAGPILMDAFKGASLDLLLDDYIRDDEKQIAKLWQADCEAIGFSCSMREIKLEKQACLVFVRTLGHEE